MRKNRTHTTKGQEKKSPLILQKVGAGFQTIVDDYVEDMLDLNAYLVKHPAATFFVRVEGDSMEMAGIFSGDLLIVDRSLEVHDGNIIVGIYDGEFTVKRLVYEATTVLLQAEPRTGIDRMPVNYDTLEVWGVVTNVIHHTL